MADQQLIRVFREEAVDRLSSPEELDRLVIITGPRSWAALAAVCLLLTVALAWGLFGSVPTRVSGSGILIHQGGRVLDAVAPASGQLLISDIAPNSKVKAGQEVARIIQVSLRQQLEQAGAVTRERQADLAEQTKLLAGETTAREANFQSRRDAIRQSLGAARSRVRYLEDMLKGEEELALKGYISRQKVADIRQELAKARQEIADQDSALVRVRSDQLSWRTAIERQLGPFRDRLAEAERKVAELRLQLREDTRVIAPGDGRVIEWEAADGARVTVGTPILSIQSGGGSLQVLLYVPPQDGKQVKPGMEVRVEPSTVKKEEYGTLVGRVAVVSDFPSTHQAMLAVLQNEKLVQQYSSQGPPFAVRIDLVSQPGTPSGYRWSSGEGPPVTLSSGTPVQAEVTTRERRPIELVIPALRKATHL